MAIGEWVCTPNPAATCTRGNSPTSSCENPSDERCPHWTTRVHRTHRWSNLPSRDAGEQGDSTSPADQRPQAWICHTLCTTLLMLLINEHIVLYATTAVIKRELKSNHAFLFQSSRSDQISDID